MPVDRPTRRVLGALPRVSENVSRIALGRVRAELPGRSKIGRLVMRIATTPWQHVTYVRPARKLVSQIKNLIISLPQRQIRHFLWRCSPSKESFSGLNWRDAFRTSVKQPAAENCILPARGGICPLDETAHCQGAAGNLPAVGKRNLRFVRPVAPADSSNPRESDSSPTRRRSLPQLNSVDRYLRAQRVTPIRNQKRLFL